MKENDLRVIKTREAIEEAFKKLLVEKDFERIKVSELCELARIDRKTFYAHYDGLDGLLDNLQTALSQNYLKRIENMDMFENVREMMREFFLYSEEQGEFYEKITCADSYLRNRMIANVMKNTKTKSKSFNALPPEKQRYVLSFYHSTTLTIYKSWIEGGKTSSAEEVADFAANLLQNGLKGII